MLLHKEKFHMTFVTILMLVGLVFFAAALPAVQANASNASTVAQVSSLNGTVVADGLVTIGTSVKEGQVLVMVKTFAGNAPAARASIDGTVAEVMVVPGSEITAGQIVVTIKP